MIFPGVINNRAGMIFLETNKKHHYYAKQDKQSRSQDRNKVAGSQDYEVKYEEEKMGVSGKEVKRAVKSVGNRRKKVEKRLKK